MEKPEYSLDPLFGSHGNKGSDAPPVYPPLAFGRFIVEREVGRGRNSVVYRAVDPADQAAVALKVLYPSAEQNTLELRAQAVQKEAERLRLLNHPHIVGVREAGIADGHAYIAFPFVRGLSLERALSGGTLERPVALAFMIQVTLAVQHAHEQSLIHRDLKPGNILVGKRGDPYVLDFGLSWKLGSKSDYGVQSIVGTPAYMSPEQARGEEEHLTPATDVYGLGAILYEILTGRPPFAADSAWRTVQLALSTPPVPPRQISSAIDLGWEHIVLWCLEKEPGKRYPTCTALVEDLRLAAAGKPPQGPRAPGLLGRIFK